ncbi:unnamed protein product, partial [Ectocarpus sp. 4 AP-2014]
YFCLFRAHTYPIEGQSTERRPWGIQDSGPTAINGSQRFSPRAAGSRRTHGCRKAGRSWTTSTQ